MGSAVKGQPDAFDDALVAELIEPYLREAEAVLREGIVADADLVDAGLIFGTGFAPFRGGPLQYLAARNRRSSPKTSSLRSRDADAGRREPERRHLRRLDHGAGRHRGGTVAGRSARGRVATVAVKEFMFKQPVQIGDLLSVLRRSQENRQHVDHRHRRGVCRAPPREPARGEGDRGDADLRGDRRHRAAPPGAARA